MKNQLSGSLRSFMQNLLTPAAFACVLGLSVIPSGASARVNFAGTESAVEVKYIGKINQQPVFQVNIENAKEDEIWLTLKDEDGSVMYSEKFKDKKLTRKFQLSSDQVYNPKVTVSIQSRNDKKSQSFEISNVNRMVEEVIITKVN